MARLVESLSNFFGRVEILARGLENERRAAELALARGRPLEARDLARTILASVPESPLGLALWADAAEDAGLDHEAAEALAELATFVPWRADVWLRLGQARARMGDVRASEALERAADAPEEREAARLALLDLCDRDLWAGDPARAGRWLDRIGTSLAVAVTTGTELPAAPDREVGLRRAECALALGDVAAAARYAPVIDPERIDGRGALVLARLAFAEGQWSTALDLGLRACILDAPGSAELLSALIAGCRDVVLVDRARRVVTAAGLIEEPAWAAAFAFAEGRRADARAALSRGLSAGHAGAAAALLRLATETRDLDALHTLAARDPGRLPEDLRTLREGAVLAAEGRHRAALGKLERVSGEAAAWAAEIASGIIRSWVPDEGIASWPDLLDELGRSARALERLDVVTSIEAIAVERERPLRVAVVGEFNAGKSTFLNALLGEDVAPTGVLPTTATLHWVAWAPDPFARIVVRGAPDRVVPHAGLKAALKSLAASGERVERVFIYAPIERLKRVEILDTPGFNAPDPDHIAAARQAFDEAHVAVWLLDASGPMKESERRVLSEIKDLGVPVQILVNKADRLAPDDLARVLVHVQKSLEETGIGSYAPPLAFSARLSLKGKLGDAAALEASGWAGVEALFAERIVDRSAELRERALRRRALRIARELASVAAARAAEDRAKIQEARATNEALLASAAKLRHERRTIAASIEKSLEYARRVLTADLRPLGDLTDERKRTDPGLEAYVEERFVSRLTDPLVHEIAQHAGVAAPPAAAASVRAALMGAVAALERPAERVDRPLGRVIEAAIVAFAAALVAAAEVGLPAAPFALLEQRAAMVERALSAKT
ncbi:dynamin family protein [Polyangium sp. y55x31]|uniref:dynamin family protein n=1 Tax=Polyangium sp. y55x31 TaxID=3042688 RepID=UPI0024822138|nr:dynamin family protein [Polyangium sp. y55x31]MDI1478766.1 dynamin family protein [Polyangium sp. y55x31]